VGNAGKPNETEDPERVFVVPEELHELRIDKALHSLIPELSRSYLRELVEGGHVRVGARLETRPRYLCQKGESLRVRLAPRRVEEGPPPPNFRVLHVDDSMLVISKPPGLPVHRNEGVRRHTVADYAQRDFGLLPTIQGAERPGIIHRLDKETSGVMVLGRTPEAFHHIRDQFRKRTVSKEYMAVILGEMRFDSEWIEKPIGRDPLRPTRMSVVPEGGLESATFVEAVERFRGYTLARCLPKTGRTHQIRVHLSSAGHPIVGDKVYKTQRWKQVLPADAPPVTRQLLHAQALEFTHPVTGKRVRFVDEPPEDFEAFIGYLRRKHSAKD
jgi:23S rRNA pseudouridine1911/1915/1917 synthase